MTSREYLSQIRELDARLEQKLSQLEELHTIAASIASLDYSKERVQVSPPPDAPYTRTAERAVELDKEISELEGRRLAIIDSIQSLGDHRYITILYKHYVEHKKFDQIHRETHYALTYLWQLHSQALDSMQNYIDKHRF